MFGGEVGERDRDDMRKGAGLCEERIKRWHVKALDKRECKCGLKFRVWGPPGLGF
jgi:hypothetical protein